MSGVVFTLACVGCARQRENITMNIIKQVDDFWREVLRMDTMNNWNLLQNKYADLVREDRRSSRPHKLPDEEQARLIRQVFDRNSEYIAMAKQDRNALKVKLEVPVYRPWTN